MENALKNFLYAGVGLAEKAGEKVESQVNEWSEKGKSSDSDLKKMVDEMLTKSEETKTEWDGKLNEFINKFGYAKTSDIAQMRQKLNDLEEKLATKKTTTTGSTATTATTKK